MNPDIFKLIIRNIRRRKLRSWLTMIGIFVGIAAVVALVSLSSGLQKVVEKEFEQLGTDKIMIMLKTQAGPRAGMGLNPLTKDDLEVVRDVSGIKRVTGLVMANAKVEYRGQVRYLMVASWPDDPEEQKLITDINDYTIEEGRLLSRQDRYKTNVGISLVKDNYFNPNIKLNDKIKINGVEFKVIGYWERIGNSGDDRSIIINEDLFRKLFNITDREDLIMAQVNPGVNPREVVPVIEKVLRKHRHLKEGDEDFVVQTSEDLLKHLNSILNVVKVVLIGIAAISLLVGGIGIMNTMYTAVLERTGEIGIMKAIGARNSEILQMFLIESGMLGLMGGAIGVIVGIAIAKGVEVAAKAYFKTNLLKAYLPWYLIAGALLFAFIIGSLSGLLPAYQASRKSPIEALRYE